MLASSTKKIDYFNLLKLVSSTGFIFSVSCSNMSEMELVFNTSRTEITQIHNRKYITF